MSDTVEHHTQIPEGFEDCLSEYGPCIFDSVCGEPVAWGFTILFRIGDARFEELRQYGTLECVYPIWFLITRFLTQAEAIEKYGPISVEEYGPRGGFKSITFGMTQFVQKQLSYPQP